MRNRFAEGPVRVGVIAVVLITLMGPVAGAEILKGELIVMPKISLGVPVGDYPVGQLKDWISINSGVALGVLVDKVASEHVSLGGELGYNVNKVDASKIQQKLSSTLPNYSPAFDWKTIQVSGHVRYFFKPAAPVNFFAHAGVGFYLNRFEQNLEVTGPHDAKETDPQSTTKSNFGVNVGPGMMVRLSPIVRLSVEALFNNVFTKYQNVRFINFTVGLAFRVSGD